MFAHIPRISRDYILKHVSEEAIFRRYLGIEPEFKSGFTNPLREDNTEDCRFYVDHRGIIKFNDFAKSWNWDCFNVVEYLYNCSFKEAIYRIAVDFRLLKGEVKPLDIDYNRKRKSRSAIDFRIQRRELNNNDISFWYDFYITPKVLSYYNVYPVQFIWEHREQKLIYSYNPENPCYAYHDTGYTYKFYFPLREKKYGRFMQNKLFIQGIRQYPLKAEYGGITKSLKDVMSLRAFGIPTIAPSSENKMLPEEVVLEIKKRTKYPFILFDWDKTGIAGALAYRDIYDIPVLFFKDIVRVKDFSDYCREASDRNQVKKLIEETKHYYDVITRQEDTPF